MTGGMPVLQAERAIRTAATAILANAEDMLAEVVRVPMIALRPAKEDIALLVIAAVILAATGAAIAAVILAATGVANAVEIAHLTAVLIVEEVRHRLPRMWIQNSASQPE